MRRAAAVAIGMLLLAVPPAGAAFPGVNGRIAFNTLRESGMQVRTATIEGRRQRVVATIPPLPAGLERASGQPQWRPDGRRIAYVRFDRGVLTMRPDGRDKRRVGGGNLLWPGSSPSGRRLVVAWGKDSPNRVATLRAGGSRERVIAGSEVEHLSVTRWSPAGRWIAFEGEVGGSGPHVWRVRAGGGGLRRLAPGRLPSWSPDGRRIAYAEGSHVRSMRPDGNGRRTLVAGPVDSSIAGLAWAPDGRSIAYVRQYPRDEHDVSVVATVPASGGRERERFRSERFIGAIDWQPLPRRRSR